MTNLSSKIEVGTAGRVMAAMFDSWPTLETANKILAENPAYFSLVISGLNDIVNKFNSLEVDSLAPEQQEMMRNTVALKESSPHLATMEEILSLFRDEFRNTPLKSGKIEATPTAQKFTETLNIMSEKMKEGDEDVKRLQEKLGRLPTAIEILDNDVGSTGMAFQAVRGGDPKGTFLGEVVHVYELLLSRLDKDGIKSDYYRKDCFTDMALELSAVQNGPLYQLFKDLHWYDGYVNLSEKLRKEVVGVN